MVATHDGERLWVGWFERGANRSTRVVALDSKGSGQRPLPRRTALSSRSAASREAGKRRPGAWLLDAAGKVAWSSPFEKTVAGVHFLPDRSLVVAAGEAKAVRVAAGGA